MSVTYTSPIGWSVLGPSVSMNVVRPVLGLSIAVNTVRIIFDPDEQSVSDGGSSQVSSRIWEGKHLWKIKYRSKATITTGYMHTTNALREAADTHRKNADVFQRALVCAKDPALTEAANHMRKKWITVRL